MVHSFMIIFVNYIVYSLPDGHGMFFNDVQSMYPGKAVSNSMMDTFNQLVFIYQHQICGLAL